jgi:SWI/SNF-related matrix-associated actin-dependent regulator of chromatin subfamily A-like protein 1
VRLLKECSICGKALMAIDRWNLDPIPGNEQRAQSALIFYKCGHFAIDEPQSFRDKSVSIASLNGKQIAYDFQIDGIDFVDRAEYNALIGDEMGLGKTIQGLLAWKVARSHFNTCLIVVKGSTTWQWLTKYKEWCSSLPLGVFLIQGSKGFIPPGFSSYIIGMDTLSRMVTKKQGYNEGYEINKFLSELGIDLLIVDECQSFKDPSSRRTVALVGLIQELKIEHKIFLSGTPIKNRANEYFTVLNLLDPESFSSKHQFESRWLQQDAQGKYARIRKHRLEEFHELISKYVIRRKKRDVQKNLPKFSREFEFVTIDDDNIKAVYNKELARIQNEADSKANLSYFDIQDNLMSLRRITGTAKVDWAFDEIQEFLESTEDEKIIIGIHHEVVRDTLYQKLQSVGVGVIKISGEDNDRRKFEKVQQFQRDTNCRVAIINMLAGGVGIDGLQHVCSRMICLERQWNAVDEEQFEARIDRDGQKFPCSARYPLIKDSIDEYFSALVEKKRSDVGSTIDKEWEGSLTKTDWDELMRETLRHKL